MHDPLFKGCTRPPMLFGAPLGPMITVNGALFMAGVLVHPILWILVPIATIIMRAVVAEDDQQFRLLALRIKCRVLRPNRNALFWKCSAYAPLVFKRRRAS